MGSLNALQSLAGSDLNSRNSGGLVQGRLRKEQLLEEMKRNLSLQASAKPGTMVVGATPADVESLESDLHGGANFGDDAQTHVAQTENTNNELNTYNRPDVRAARDQQEAAALRKVLMPLKVKGEYDVEAARQSQIGRNEHDERMIAAQSALENTRQTSMASRAEANQEAITSRARLQALQTGKAHATRPSGVWDSLFGPSQKSLDDAEIAQLLGGHHAGGHATIAMIAPNGQVLQVPESDVAEAEALGARRQ